MCGVCVCVYVCVILIDKVFCIPDWLKTLVEDYLELNLVRNIPLLFNKGDTGYILILVALFSFLILVPIYAQPISSLYQNLI